MAVLERVIGLPLSFGIGEVVGAKLAKAVVANTINTATPAHALIITISSP
jgi:hypothetical protein